MVIFAHIESFKKKGGQPSLLNIKSLNAIVDNIGHQGVVIFFTLSGFLITYLLLVERSLTAKIDVKKFYMRRALRIWPLYFLIIFLGFFVLPHILNPAYFPVKTTPDFFLKFFLSVFFLPNALLFIYGSIFSIGVLWSIGTEEQFYLIWPYVVKKIKSHLLPKFLIVVLASIVLLKIILWWLLKQNSVETVSYKVSFVSYHFLEYDSMVLGALTAILYFSRGKIIEVLYTVPAQIITYILLCSMLVLFPDLGAVNNLIFSSMYAIIILNIATNSNSIFKAVNPILEYLGKISFGMYLYHSICIAIGLKILQKLHIESSGLGKFNFALYILSFGLTILISTISFYKIERPFLKYKKGFMVVKSGEKVNNPKQLNVNQEL